METYVNATWECEHGERLAYATSIDAFLGGASRTFMLRVMCEKLRTRSLESLQALVNAMITKGKALEHLQEDLHGPWFQMTYAGVIRNI